MLGSQNAEYATKAQYAAAAQQNAYTSGTDVRQSEAERILERLRDLQSKMHEIIGMSRVVNDKIVGPAPEKMPAPNNGGQVAPIPQGFLHSSSQIISDIDAAASDIAEQLSRLHRSF